MDQLERVVVGVAAATLLGVSGSVEVSAQREAQVGAASSPLANRLAIRVQPGVRLRQVAAGGWVVDAPAASRTHVTAVQLAINGAGGMVGVSPMLTVTPGAPDLAASLGLDRDYMLTLGDAGAASEVLSALNASDSVIQEVLPAGAGFFTDDAGEYATSSDPLFAEQYALHNTGQVVQGQKGVAGADVDVAGAWARYESRRPVVIALLDSGVANHPDLAGRLVPGWNTQLNSSFTGDENSSHGTHLAGIIGAVSGNGVGIAGVWPDARIMPVKVSNATGYIGMDWVASGIVWAADHGADILSISIGFNTPSAGLESAVQYASAQGCLIVASSGNVPTSPIVAPGRFADVICVGATDNRDDWVTFSATGPEIDLVAPGYDVLSTWHQWHLPSTYQYKSGTSQAVPHVAATAAMVMSVNPWLHAAQVRVILLASAEDLGPAGWDPTFGQGRLDAGRAVAMAASLYNASNNQVPGCLADFNRDGRLNSDDYFMYLALFVDQDPRADLVWPMGVWNGDDFLKYTEWYVAGCGP